MACRYLDPSGAVRICSACQPARAPTRDELRLLCLSQSQRGCDFFRFRRATGRALLVEDFLAWRRKRQASGRADPHPGG